MIHYSTGDFTLTGRIVDAATGQKVGARVQVIGNDGAPLAPPDAMWKIGTGEPFFYSDGEFSLSVPRGRVQITVERGTEYVPWRRTVEFTEPGDIEQVIELERWCDPAADGWHPGNLHLHYKETEEDPDRRIMYDSRIEDLRVTALSYVKRWDFAYASNRYAPGVLRKFTDARHYVQCGEETRHYMGGGHIYGFGHVMLLDIRNVVNPPGRGLLIDAFSPEYPPISYACDDTHRQDGVVIWCHNGHGIEASVAAILGKVDALSLWDVYWEDLEYDAWYGLLNCGIRLPASTGSDWFLCSANRVYTKTQPEFEYTSWMQALRDGKTFITNGPMLGINVEGSSAGDTVQASSRRPRDSEHRLDIALPGPQGGGRRQRQTRSHEGPSGRVHRWLVRMRGRRCGRRMDRGTYRQQLTGQFRPAHMGPYQPRLYRQPAAGRPLKEASPPPGSSVR